MKILILDDDERRHIMFKRNFSHHALTLVYTAEDAIEAFKHNVFDATFLDHDLGGHTFVDSHGPESTGFTVAKWLSENPDKKPKEIYIHSYNPDGAKNMQQILPGSKHVPGLRLMPQ